MSSDAQPFIASKALAAGRLTRHELRTYYRAIMPNVYLDRLAQPSLRQRITAASLWSGRQAVIAGSAASAIHGSRWIDEDAPVELIWRNARAPRGVIARDDWLADGEFIRVGGLCVTTPDRTAFDIGRRDRLGQAVVGLDALAAATHFKVDDVRELAAGHRRARGLRQLETALDLVDGGAQSPKETWLRLLLIRAGLPEADNADRRAGRRRTTALLPRHGLGASQIGSEYDGGQHWTDPWQYANDVTRQEYLARIGWTVVRVVSRRSARDVIHRVQAAHDALTLR